MDKIFSLNLRHLAALPATARAGSISRAAEAVNLSQPALAQAIGKIERVLDCQLFERQPDGVVLTPAGKIMTLRVERALRYLLRGVRLARRSTRLQPVAHIERRLTMAQLRALIAVESSSSYALAAKQTGLSQPAVHRAVRDLQQVLGITLLIRVGRAVHPADAASRFARFARLMLSELRAGMDEIGALGDSDAGRIRLGTLPLARAMFLPDLLARFAAAHPATLVEVIEAPYGELLNTLRQGEIDLLIGARRDPPPASDVVQEDLFDDEPVIVGRLGHPLCSSPTSPTPADMLAFPWVIPAHGAPMRGNWERMFLSQGIKPPQLRIESGSVLIARGLMLQGDWLTLMSRDQFQFERRAGMLAEISAPGPALHRRIVMATRSDWRPTRLQTDFVERARTLGQEHNRSRA